MSEPPIPQMKEYVGYIWIDDQPGIRLSVMARTSSEAKAAVIDEYGDGHTILVWNAVEEDTPRTRA